jgi:hypothetical protein
MSDHQSSRRIFGLGSRHPRKIAFLRIGIGIYLLVLTAVLIATGVGGPWAWVAGGFAAVHFALAYRLLRIVRPRAGLHAGLS